MFTDIKHSAISVKDYPQDEQPREKLMRYGAQALSDAELLAIVMRTGSKQLNVIDTSRALLTYYGGLGLLFRKNWESLRVIPGIANVKAITLEAVFELCRRIQTADFNENTIFNTPKQVADYFIPRMRDLATEQCVVVMLNTAKRLIRYKKISMGNKSTTIVDPSEVYKTALQNDAHSIVVLHNHPSGNPEPSHADVTVTNRLIAAGKMINIPLNDHLIIVNNTFVSIREEGLADF